MNHIGLAPTWLPSQGWREECNGGKRMVMEAISVDKAKTIANKTTSKRKYILKPGRVDKTNKVQFTNGKNPRVKIISWDEFEDAIKKRRLEIRESNGWMKIMKKR